MKIASGIDSEDWRHLFVTCPVVFLDGERVVRVISADDDLGMVEHYEGVACGDLRRCHCGAQLVARLSFGRVEIRGRRRGAP